MKISDYIAHLERIKAENGDLEVETYSIDGRRHDAQEPKLSFKLILKGREHKPRFWSKYEGDDRKGEPVCYI